jgi:hypothetical protein
MLPADYQAQILAETGDPTGSIGRILPILWAMYLDKSDAPLIALYVKRAVLDMRLAEEASDVDTRVATSDGAVLQQIAASQQFTHLQQMRADVHAELLRVEGKSRASRGVAYGTIAATAPTSPPFPDSADRNDSRYTGDVYKPLRRL